MIGKLAQPQPFRPRDDRSAGFTLIELLVSLTILSLCAVLLGGGVTTAGIVARRTQDSGQALLLVSAAQMQLRARIEAMLPVRRFDLATPVADVIGLARSFEFFAPAPDREPGRGVMRYRLVLTAPGDLILYSASERAADFDRNASDMKGWTAATLLRGVAGMHIDYFGVTPKDPIGRWRTNWTQNSRIPTALRVRVDFPDDDRRVWPDFIVRPAATLDLACNPESQQACGSAQ